MARSSKQEAKSMPRARVTVITQRPPSTDITWPHVYCQPDPWRLGQCKQGKKSLTVTEEETKTAKRRRKKKITRPGCHSSVQQTGLLTLRPHRRRPLPHASQALVAGPWWAPWFPGGAWVQACQREGPCQPPCHPGQSPHLHRRPADQSLALCPAPDHGGAQRGPPPTSGARSPLHHPGEGLVYARGRARGEQSPHRPPFRRLPRRR